jgi:hypothetical protein
MPWHRPALPATDTADAVPPATAGRSAELEEERRPRVAHMKLERLTTSADSVAATVIKGLLEEAGIPVMLRAYQSAGWLFPGTPGSLGAMEVLVPGERLKQARRVLAEAEAAAAEAAAAEANAAAGAAATTAETSAATGEGARGRTPARRGTRGSHRAASGSRHAASGPRGRRDAVD